MTAISAMPANVDLLPQYRQQFQVPSLFDDVAGHLLVRNCYLGEWVRFRVVTRSGAVHSRAIQVKRRVIKNDDPDERIIGVVPGCKHRILWLTGPSARAHMIAVIPEARRWHRRQRVKAAIRRALRAFLP